MGKIIVPRKNFTVVDNYHLRDMNLSLKAIGLFDKMLSLPPGWDYSVRGLTKICKESINTIRSSLNELEKFGYLERSLIRDDQGRFKDCDYILHELPCYKNPHTDNRDTENCTQLIKEESNTSNNISHFCALKHTNQGYIDERCRNCYLINQCPFQVNQKRIEKMYGDSEYSDIVAMEDIFFSNPYYDLSVRAHNGVTTLLEERFLVMLNEDSNLIDEGYRRKYKMKLLDST